MGGMPIASIELKRNNSSMIYILAGVIFILRFFVNLYTFDYQMRLLFPAILSAVMIIVFYRLTTVLFKNHDIGLIAAFLLIISPWQHALMYRSVLGSVLVLLITTTVYFFTTKQKTARFVSSILLVLCFGVLIYQEQTIGEIAHEQGKVIWRQITTDGAGQPVVLTRLLHNKVFETIWFAAQRLSTYFEPQGFFITGSYFVGPTVIGAGFMLTALFPFFLYGMVSILKKNKDQWLLWWLLLGVLPGVISIHVQHMLLGSPILPMLLIIASVGLYEWLKHSPIKMAAAFCLLVFNYLFVFAQYMPLL